LLRSRPLNVVGSVNLDLVAGVERLPRAGETLTAHLYERIPGGKGANQALAAARLGAKVRFVCAVGPDRESEEALANLRDLELVVHRTNAPTGIALILVADDGENQIIVVPGANALLAGATGPYLVGEEPAALCQLEVPDTVLVRVREEAAWLCVNAAPARPLPIAADLVVANRYELDVIGEQPGRVALTLGAEGAVLLEAGREVARARPPRVEAVDGTAAGDAFTACLVVSLLEGREDGEALQRACAAGALAASRFGAQPSLPSRDELDAILAA
jgi:ribokinase